MEEVIYSATSHNIAAIIVAIHARGWRIIDKVVVAIHQVQLAKGHAESIYDYHLIVQRPALAYPSSSAMEAACQ